MVHPNVFANEFWMLVLKFIFMNYARNFRLGLTFKFQPVNMRTLCNTQFIIIRRIMVSSLVGNSPLVKHPPSKLPYIISARDQDFGDINFREYVPNSAFDSFTYSGREDCLRILLMRAGGLTINLMDGDCWGKQEGQNYTQ